MERYRAEVREIGEYMSQRPYSLIVTEKEDGDVFHIWGAPFTTMESAKEGALALVETGCFYRVFIEQTLCTVGRAR